MSLYPKINKKMKLKISTKTQGKLVDREVEELYIETIGGQMGILAGHMPIVTALKPEAKVKCINSGELTEYKIRNGFIEVDTQSNINIIADQIIEAPIS